MCLKLLIVILSYTNLAKQSMESMFDLYEKNYPTVDTSGIRSH